MSPNEYEKPMLEELMLSQFLSINAGDSTTGGDDFPGENEIEKY